MKIKNKTLRIIASDFDGTLMREASVTYADSESIKIWQKKGNLFGLVTGRDLYAAKKSGRKGGRDISRLYNLLLRSLHA